MPSPSLRSPLQRAQALFRVRVFALLVLSLSIVGCVAHIGPPTDPQEPGSEPPIVRVEAIDFAAELLEGAADGAAFATYPAIINGDGVACVVTTIFAQSLPAAAEAIRARGGSIPQIEVSILPCLALLDDVDPALAPEDIALLQATAVLTGRSLHRVARYAALDSCEASVVIEGVASYVESDLARAVGGVLQHPGQDLIIASYIFDFAPCRRSGAEPV